MKKIIFIISLFVSFNSFSQTISTEVLSFYNSCINPTDSGGIVIKTKLPFGSQRYMPTIAIDGFNYGTAQSIGLMVNYYVYDSGSGNYFSTSKVSSHGGYAPDVYLFNDAGFVSIFLKRGASQYCVSFKVRAWLRIPTDGGATADWFTGWTASGVNAPPTATSHYTKLAYQNSMGALTTTADATINGLRVGIGKGSANIGYGSGALLALTTGAGNTAIGESVLRKVTVGNYNTALGAYALYEAVGGERSVAIGYEAMRGYGSSSSVLSTSSVAAGFRALKGNTTTPSKNTGVANAAFGTEVLSANESGSYNIGIGIAALARNIKGGYNVAIGPNTLLENTAKSYNIAIGHLSQANATNDTTTANTYNTSVGAFSLMGNAAPAINTGTFNAAFGSYTLSANKSGNNQSGFGTFTLRYSTGNNNSAFGYNAGYDLTTGTNNLFLGYNTGGGIITGSGNTVIGAGLIGLPATLTNTVIIGASGLERMRIDQNGNVGIGISTIPAAYKLAIDGNVVAEKIVVKNSTNWPDYVFKRGYSLPGLAELEKFINQNSHLPEIPSAKEVEANGQDLGEMNRLLLKKVEELTLYLIEQNNRIKTLEAAINKPKENK